MLYKSLKDKNIWFAEYFSHSFLSFIRRYSTDKPLYQIDIQLLQTYDYPIYLDSPFSLITNINNYNSDIDDSEMYYHKLFNDSEISFDRYLSTFKLNIDLDISYLNNHIQMSFLFFNGYYFSFYKINNHIDLNILTTNKNYTNEDYLLSLKAFEELLIYFNSLIDI